MNKYVWEPLPFWAFCSLSVGKIEGLVNSLTQTHGFLFAMSKVFRILCSVSFGNCVYLVPMPYVEMVDIFFISIPLSSPNFWLVSTSTLFDQGW